MAKERPYFKFYTGEWANGSIVLEDFNVQGVFINVCCWYWSTNGEITKKQLSKRFKEKEVIDTLLEEDIIKIDDEKIVIDFLDEQLLETEYLREKARAAGIKSAQKRKENKEAKLNAASTTVQRPLNNGSTNPQPLKEKKTREKKRKEDNKKEYFKDPLLNSKYIEFLNFRKEIKKPLKEVSIAANIKSLLKLSNNNTTLAIEIIEQSIANGWAGLFEIKNSHKPQTTLPPSKNQSLNGITYTNKL